MKTFSIASDHDLLQWLRRAAALPDAPAALVQSALNLWPAAHAVHAAPATATASAAPLQPLRHLAQALWKRVIAELRFDSWAQPGLALGMRAAASSTRHLLFCTQGRDIDLRISPSAERFALTGQVLGPDESGRVELSAPGLGHMPPWVTALDDLGEFRLDDLHSGTYALTLRLGGEEIVLAPIVVGEAAA